MNFEFDMMVPMALWNNVEIEIDLEVACEVVVEMANVEVVVAEEMMKTVDYVHVVEIGNTYQNSGNTLL